MPEGIDITVRNRLVTEKRDLSIYHHAKRGAYLISHGNSITIPLGTSGEGDFLHLSMVSGPVSMEKECLLNIPSWCHFTVSGLGNGDISFLGNGTGTILRIPPGPPVWQLKITRPSGHVKELMEDYVIIGDEEHKPGENINS